MTPRVLFPLIAIALFAHPAVAAPWYGPHGIDLSRRDATTKPGDDFYRSVNGAWMDRITIPADKPGYSLRLAISDTTERRLHEILEEAAAKPVHEPADLAGKVGAFYRSFMDSERVEVLGARPLAEELDAIRGTRTRADVAALMGRQNSGFFGALFGVYVDVDLKNPKRYAIYLGQAGLGLPDRDYYLKPSFAAQKQAYRAYVVRMLGALAWPEAEKRADEILALEDRVASASWTKTQQRDPIATYNPMSLAQLDAIAPGFAWGRFLAGAGLGGTPRVIVAERSAFPKLAAIFARTPLPTLRAWLAFSAADQAAPYLSPPFADAVFEMRNRTLSGQQVQAARWKRGVRAVSGGDFLAGDRYDRFGNMGYAVGQLFSERYFPPRAKAVIEDLVANVMAAYHARIQALDWMSPATRAKAIEKLDTYRIKVGYPDTPRDYSTLVVRDDDLLGNVRRAGQLDWDFYRNRRNGPVDVTDWGMTPQTNDAYNGELRDIVFPAGILQPPVFDADADPAYNYGAAGGVIGHELTHGFDDEGRKFDAEGKLNDWWAPADAKVFEERAAMLGRQYDAYEPLPGAHVSGDLTMGENIADLGGLTLALEAYRYSLHGAPAPLVDGLTGDQRVFLGWAQAWCGKTRDEALRRQVVSDPHSPRMYRVNGVVRNIDAWYETFGVQPGDKLYLPPEQRVRIW